MAGGSVSVLVVLLVAAVLVVDVGAFKYSSIDLGDRLHRDYTQYIALPTNATAKGQKDWVAINASHCDPNLGIAYAEEASGPSSTKPVVMYFSPSGAVVGIGVHIYGDVKPNLLSQGFFKKVGDKEYRIDVSFRSPDDVCSTRIPKGVLGNQLVINQDTIAYGLPLLEDEATAAKWTRGACFSGMGYHYFYDLKSAPAMSWEASNLVPIVVMFSEGQINAFFFASSDVQQGITGTHMWERIPLPNVLMCKNWCDKSCTFHDTHAFSTLHVYLRDYTKVGCPNGCTIGCCP